MGPIKFNLSVASVGGLMVCLLTLVTVGHAAIETTADDGDVSAGATVNRKVTVDGGHQYEELPPLAKPTAAKEGRKATESVMEPCREACSKKHSTKESLCSQRRNCSTCQRKCILESISPSTGDSLHRLTLVLLQMIRNESLVTADVAWVNAADSRSSANHSHQQHQQQQQQCLVTWEVSGGGLMGNLLTESSTVQLSLWPETNYRVQVTCRSKHTNTMIRSAPIVLNTSTATSVGQGQSKNPVADESEAQIGLEELVPASNPKTSNGQNDIIVTCRNDSSDHPNGLREVLLLGVYVTLLVFLMILLTLISFIQPKPKPVSLDKEVSSPSSASSTSSDTCSIASDKQVLVANDVMAAEMASVAGTEILHV
ncbi:transmembrane protein fend [Aedes aegypti]|uniref:Uncharacterized protein n=1 Tax=Aedes aegypti TaxID=7159 RepID=A0A6I8T5W3_AEDAE|nr:transmembrane protein fend [Aedes aegypti]